MTEKPTLSIALLENEKIRGDVNAHLSVSGHRLEITSSPEGRKALKVVRSSSGADIGLMIAASPECKKVDGVHQNGVGVWFSSDHFLDARDNEMGRKIVDSIARAEDEAHARQDDKTKPAFGVEIQSGLSAAQKGRMAASNWYQEGLREDGSIPRAKALQLMQAQSTVQFADENGHYATIKSGDYIGRDTKGRLSGVSAFASMGQLDVERSDPAEKINKEAQRSVNVMYLLKQVNQPVAVYKEESGRGSVVCQSEDGKVHTLEVSASVNAAQSRLRENFDGFVARKRAIEKNPERAPKSVRER